MVQVNNIFEPCNFKKVIWIFEKGNSCSLQLFKITLSPAIAWFKYHVLLLVKITVCIFSEIYFLISSVSLPLKRILLLNSILTPSTHQIALKKKGQWRRNHISRKRGGHHAAIKFNQREVCSAHEHEMYILHSFMNNTWLCNVSIKRWKKFPRAMGAIQRQNDEEETAAKKYTRGFSSLSRYNTYLCLKGRGKKKYVKKKEKEMGKKVYMVHITTSSIVMVGVSAAQPNISKARWKKYIYYVSNEERKTFAEIWYRRDAFCRLFKKVNKLLNCDDDERERVCEGLSFKWQE